MVTMKIQSLSMFNFSPLQNAQGNKEVVMFYAGNLQTCTGIEGVASSTRFPLSSNKART
jgi:hypothetical protein